MSCWVSQLVSQLSSALLNWSVRQSVSAYHISLLDLRERRAVRPPGRFSDWLVAAIKFDMYGKLPD